MTLDAVRRLLDLKAGPVRIGGRVVVYAWPGERIVVWASTRTPYQPAKA